MKLEALRRGIQDFATTLTRKDGGSHLYKYDMLNNFANCWAFDTDDFAGMYDAALESQISRRWWKRPNYRPKEVMIALIKTESEYAKYAFRDLFDESKDIEGRVDRFIYYCDELLHLYKRANPKSVDNNHYQDSMMISLYLSALFPDRYTLYPGKEVFNAFLQNLEARDTGGRDALVRFWKLTRVVYKYIMENSQIQKLMDSGLRPKKHLLISHECIMFLAGHWKNSIP